ncbi:hypothetical protein [Actinoplanes sp. NPDC049118]|uniref:hypothetical protein n=1 Tax=Actinoplanes sp. NPDC049118 TaxID=3155769 RepID=UPI0033F79307
MFAGLDDIDWASMRHAYGTAGEVPRLIRGLVSRDGSRRAWAGEAYNMAVHHQGDIYECTTKTVPFLIEAAGTPGLKGRPRALRLLASIGESAGDGRRGEWPERAHRAVQVAYPLYERLALADPRPKVRRAAVAAMLACPDHAKRTATVLMGRVAAEPSAAVQVEIVEAVGTLDAPGAGDWFAGLARDHPHPRVRLAALTEWLRCTDEGAEGADDPVPMLLDLLHAGGGDLRSIGSALGDRVPTRVRLLARAVRGASADWLNNARWATGGMSKSWRGDYTELVCAFAEHLDSADRERRRIAIYTLTELGPLAAPAADAMLAQVERALAAGEPAYDSGQGGFWLSEGATYALVNALAAAGDPRILPAVGQVLAGDRLPRYPASLVRRLGPEAEPMVIDAARRCLAAGDTERFRALAYGRPALAPESLPILLTALDSAKPKISDVWAVAALGPAAADAEPRLRGLLDAEDSSLARWAADALHAIGVDFGELLPAYRRLMADPWDRQRIVSSLADVGPAAAPLADLVREAMAVPGDGHRAAVALWRITGDADAALPAMLDGWRHARYAHTGLAECFAELGPRAAAAEPLLRAELADPRRATHDGASSAIEDDEEFLASVRNAITAVSSA